MLDLRRFRGTIVIAGVLLLFVGTIAVAATAKIRTCDTCSPGGGASSPSLEKSGPIIAQSGDVITGKKITSPQGPCVSVAEGAQNVVIADNEIGPCGDGSHPSVDDLGVHLRPGSARVTISRNRIHDVSSGVWAQTAQNPITVDHNVFYGVRGPFPRGQAVQFDRVSGGSGQSKVSYNTSDKEMAGLSPTHYEDHINMYMSFGASGMPILIGCNRLRGGDSRTGSGVVVGDYGGGSFSILHNVIVLTSNVGIGVVGGTGVIIDRNLVYNAGADRSSLTQDAFLMMSYAGQTPTDVTITNNRGIARAWKSNDGEFQDGVVNDGTAIRVTDNNNNWEDHSLTSAIWDLPLNDC